MSTEITKPQFNPFAKNQLPEHANVGAVAIEQERAIAEAQGKLIIAKRFPRDEARAFQMAMDSCSRPGLAAVATYKFPKGKIVTGPSIRLAEELARCWGNIDYGIRELSRKEGVSEMEAYAWDLQTNTMSSQKFTVRHVRDKQEGGVSLESERDIYEVTANMGARRLRARLLAILPPDLVAAAEGQCRDTLKGNTQLPIADRVRSLLGMFVNYGVKEQQLSKYLGKSLDEVIEEDLVNLHEVYNSIQQGISKPSEWFGGQAEQPKPDEGLGAALAEQAAKATKKEPTQDEKRQAYVENRAKAYEYHQQQGNEREATAVYEDVRTALINEPAWFKSFEALIAEEGV